MRVAVVHNVYREEVPSGENQAVASLVEKLNEFGLECRPFFVSSGQEVLSPLASLRAGITTATGRSPSALIADVEDWKPDVVHIHNTFPFIGTSIYENLSAPIVTTLHNYRPVCAAGTLSRKGQHCVKCVTGSSLASLRYKCYRGSLAATIPLAIATRAGGPQRTIFQKSKIVTVLHDRFLENLDALNLGDIKIQVVPNFSNIRLDKDEPTLSSNSDYFIFAGRLEPEKGVSELIAMWPDHLPLRVFGAGSLEQAVKKKSETSSSWDFRGFVSGEEVNRNIRSARAIVIASLWGEGFPTVLQTALAFGTPALVASTTDLAEAGSSTQKFLYSYDDRNSLLTSANSLLKSNGDSRAAAKQYFEENFSDEAVFRKHLELYSAATGKR